jgi:hypothetical protein
MQLTGRRIPHCSLAVVARTGTRNESLSVVSEIEDVLAVYGTSIVSQILSSENFIHAAHYILQMIR